MTEEEQKWMNYACVYHFSVHTLLGPQALLPGANPKQRRDVGPVIGLESGSQLPHVKFRGRHARKTGRTADRQVPPQSHCDVQPRSAGIKSPTF